MANNLDSLHDIMPAEMVTLYKRIDTIFSLLNYNKQNDDVDSVFMDGNISPNTMARTINTIYREHIDSVLTAQGVFVINLYQIPFGELTELVSAFGLLGTTKLTEAVDMHEINNEDDPFVYFAEIIASITELDPSTVLSLIGYLSPTLLGMLHLDIPTSNLITLSETRAINRIKELQDVSDTFMYQTLKRTNKFGMSMGSYITAYLQPILANANNDINKIAKEIVVLAVASSTETEHLKEEMLSFVDKFALDTRTQLQLNAAILRIFEYEVH